MRSKFWASFAVVKTRCENNLKLPAFCGFVKVYRWPTKYCIASQKTYFRGVIYRPSYWRTKEVLQHGGSIPSSIILRGTFRRIFQVYENAQTLNLENWLLYLSSIISQFLDFIHCMVFAILFLIARQCTHSIRIKHLLTLTKNLFVWKFR